MLVHETPNGVFLRLPKQYQRTKTWRPCNCGYCMNVHPPTIDAIGFSEMGTAYGVHYPELEEWSFPTREATEREKVELFHYVEALGVDDSYWRKQPPTAKEYLDQGWDLL